jgi:RNA polymerase sigma-70 factor (ECF subfamily)
MTKSARKPDIRDISLTMTEGSRRSADRSDASAKGCLTPAAFAERFEGVSRTLWCIAAAVVGDRTAADDVLQEAAMIALGKLDQFEPESNFLGWMARIVRFVALNHGRRRAAHSLVDPDSLDRSRESPLTSQTIIQSEHHSAVNGHGLLHREQNAFDDRVLAALNALEPSARACLLLRVVHHMPYREIARALDMAEGTAMSHVHRARIALRDALSSHATPAPIPGDAHAAG